MKTSTYYTKNKILVDFRYKKFKSLVNMSAKEMKLWKKEPCSKAASIKRLEVINRVTRLVEKPKTFWNYKDFVDSAKVISYLSRATAIKDSIKPASKLCRRGKNYYALKNWAFDRAKVKRRNPDLNTDEGIREQLNYLAMNSEDVILNIQTGMDSNYNSLYKKYHGIIKKLEKGIYPFTFQFNPLNQYLYKQYNQEDELNSPRSIYAYNEEHSITNLNIFETDDIPTFEWKFTISKIDYIDNHNELYTDIKQFNPKEIE